MRAKEAGMLLLFVSAFTALAETREFNGLTFVADGDAATYAWDSENSTLTLTGAGPYFLTGTNTVELGATWIVSSSSAGATLSISNLVMAAPRLRSTLTVTSGTSLHIFVAGTNSISSAKAGIHVPAGASLAISRAPGFLNDNAVLTASASDGAGIGGERSSRNGAITIHGGTVTARAGNGAAGIGTGGFDNAQGGKYECGDITIYGGRVHAYGNGRGAGIGGGAYVNWQGTIRISGGVVRALGAFCGIGTGFPANYTTYMTTFITGGNVVSEYNEAWSGAGSQRWIQGAIRNEVDGSSGSRSEFTGFEPWQRVVVKNVSDAFGSRDLTANEDGVVWLWTSAYGRSVVPAEPVGVTADGVDVWEGEGLGWTYSSSSGVLELDGTKEVILSGECATNAVRVRVSGGGETAVTVSNLVLRTNGGSNNTSWRHAIEVTPGTTAILYIAGTNRFEAAYYACGLGVEEGAALVIDKAPGCEDEEVELTGVGHQGAGIGSLGYSHYPTGRIEIRGGTVRAAGNPGISNHGGIVVISGGVVHASVVPTTGVSAAGIGAPAYQCDAGTTHISGGTVVAVGGSYGAAIGGSRGNNAGTVLITGGNVTANGGRASAGIGVAYEGTGGRVVIAGGTVAATAGSSEALPGDLLVCDIGSGKRNSAGCSVMIAGGSVHGLTDMITNAVGVTGSPVVCHVLDGLTPGAAYSLEGVPAGYGMNDIYADGDGRLYVWCAAECSPSAIEGTSCWGGGGSGGSSGGYTQTTPIPVPHSWLERFPIDLALNGNNYELFGNATAANGRTVWECYVADLDPTDRDSDLVAGIELENGIPRVYVLRGRSQNRTYRILGLTSLDPGETPTDVTDISDLSATSYRFFRITVSLPAQ